MYGSYGKYYYPEKSLVSMGGNVLWIALSLIAAVIGGIVIYCTFMSKKNENKYTGFLGKLYEFLTFKKMVVEDLLKLTYLMAALFITLSSFAVISTSVVGFILYLVFGNLAARVFYELALVALVICKNTTEINDKLNSKTIIDKKANTKETKTEEVKDIEKTEESNEENK